MFFTLGFGYLCVRHPLQVLGFGEPAMMIMMTTSRSRQISETLQLQTAVDFRGCLSPMTDGAVAAMSQSHDSPRQSGKPSVLNAVLLRLQIIPLLHCCCCRLCFRTRVQVALQDPWLIPGGGSRRQPAKHTGKNSGRAGARQWS